MADNKKDVFISYGREPDVIVFVEQLKRDLEIKGFSVWLDKEDIKPGSDWRAEITTGVGGCSTFIPVITPKYVSSRNCINELYEADNDGKAIYPIIYSDTDFTVSDNAKGVKFVVSSINWTMCRPGVDDYSRSIDTLIQTIRTGQGLQPSVASGTNNGSAQCKDILESDDVEKVTTGVSSSRISCLPQSTRPIKTILGLKNPNGIAVSHDGKILIAMMEANEIWVFDNESYERIGTIGGEGHTPGKFYAPFGVAVDHDNHVIITCAGLECVQRFTIEGEYVQGAGKPGKGEFELQAPNGVTVGKDGKIYVCDLGNNRIQILSNDMKFLGNFCKTDPQYGSGCLSNPNGIAINSQGNVFVADMTSHCIQVFTPEGGFITRIGKQGHIGGCLQGPMVIAIDSHDTIYVGDGMCRVSVFTIDGNFLRHFGSNGLEQGCFAMIRGLCIDNNKLYVSEWQTNRVQIFQ